MNSFEALPAVWDDLRDVPFFRITSRLFDSSFLAGASVLLGSYDGEPTRDPTTVASGCRRDRNSGPVPRHVTAVTGRACGEVG